MSTSTTGGALEFDLTVNMDQLKKDFTDSINNAVEQSKKIGKELTAGAVAGARSIRENITAALQESARIAPLIEKGVAGIDTGKLEDLSNSVSGAVDEFEVLNKTLAFIKKNFQDFSLNPAEFDQLSDSLVKIDAAFSAIGEKQVSVSSSFNRLKSELAKTSDPQVFKETLAEASELEEKLKTVRAELKLAGSNAPEIAASTEALRGLIGGYQTLAGTVALFTGNNEEAEKTIKSLIAVMSVLQGIEEVSKVLEKDSALNVFLLSQFRRTATIATEQQAIATTGLTIAHTAEAAAARSATVAQVGLNTAMKLNPAAVLIGTLAAIVAGFKLFGKEASDVKTKTELLADSQKKFSDRMAESEAKVRPYIDALKKANLTEGERLTIYNQLKEIDPKIIDGIDAKKISYQNLTEKINGYLDALRTQYRLEANKDAITESIKQEQELEKRIASIQKKVDAAKKKAPGYTYDPYGVSSFANAVDRDNLESLQKDLQRQKEITGELGTEQIKLSETQSKSHKRNLGDIDAEIKALKDKQQTLSESSKQYFDYQDQINKLEKERTSITGATKAELAAANKLESAINSLLEKRSKLIDDIAAKQRDAKQSGLLKQQSEIEKINEEYDLLLNNVTDFNNKINEFNAKNPKARLSVLSQNDINNLNAARSLEITNATRRENARVYIDDLETQKKKFEQYEEAKKTIGINKANEMFDEQRQGFNSYLEYLQAEITKISPKLFLGNATIEDLLKFQEISKNIKEQQDQQAQDRYDNEITSFSNLLSATITYNQKKADINKKYDELERELNKNKTLSDFEDRKRMLQQSRAEELETLSNNLLRQSDLYKKLNQDIIGFSRDRIEREIKLLEDQLKKNKSLTPQQIADIQNIIAQYKALLTETNKFVQFTEKAASRLTAISGGLDNIAGSVEGLNQELADTLHRLSDITRILADTASAAASFAAGDINGGITSAANAVAGIIEGFAKAKQSKLQAEKDIFDFQNRILSGEQQYNELLRERERQQILLNKLTLEGLTDQKKLLEEQKKATLTAYNDILAKLQSESYVDSLGKKKKGGSIFGGLVGFFAGSRTIVTQELQSLIGKSYEDIEKLFNQDRLTERAKELFLQLQKIKQEGQDIDQLLADNAEAFREAITGTTSDNIIQSITDGFAEGKNSAADFADTFQELMKRALLQALQLKYLEGPLKEFFNQFATLSETDGQLTASEVTDLQNLFNSIIDNASQQFEAIQQIAGININGIAGQGNSLAGAIKGITEPQAELLAGQFGGLRITAIDQLNVARQSLEVQNMIQANTGMTVLKLQRLIEKFDSYENGTRRIKVEVI